MEGGGRRTQYLVATTAALSLAVHGTYLGWASPVLPKLQADDSPVPITSSQGSWIASIGSITGMAAIMVVPFTVDVFGRKKVMLAAAVPVIVHWLLIAFADSFAMLMAAKAVASCGAAVMSTVCPMYLAEIGETEIRGALSALYQVMLYSGYLYISCTAPFMSVSTSALVAMILPAVFMLTFVWAPESPYFFMQRGNENEATESLLKLRQKTDVADVKWELESTRKAIAQKEQTRGSFKDLFLNRSYRRTLLVVCGLAVLQVASGAIALVTYATTIFISSGSSLDANTSAIVIIFVQLVASIVSVLLLDRAGRRSLMIWTFLGCALAQIAEGSYFFLADVMEVDVTALYWLPLAALIAFQVIFALGIGSVLFVLMGEIFHVSVKGLSTSLVNMLMSLTAFVVQKMYQVVSDASSPAYAFWGFGVICLSGAAYTYIFVPETKGKTFAEINEEMNTQSSPVAEEPDNDEEKTSPV